MQYSVFGNSEFLGTFETDFKIEYMIDILEKVFEHQNLGFVEMNGKEQVKNKFYIHSYRNGDFRDVIFLGTFETNLKLIEVYDLLVQIFAKEPDGIFVRKEKLVC